MPVYRTASANIVGNNISIFHLMEICLNQIADKGGMKRLELRAPRVTQDRWGNNLQEAESLSLDKLISLDADPLVAVSISYREASDPSQYISVAAYTGHTAEAGAQVLGDGIDRLGALLEQQVSSEKDPEPEKPPVYMMVEASWCIIFRWAQKDKPQQQWTGTVLDQGGIDEAFELLVTSIIEARKMRATKAA